MSSFFSAANPGWALLLPLLVSAGTAGLVRIIGGPGRGSAAAGLGIACGALAGWLLLRGVPALPPRGIAAYTPYVALIGGVLGTLALAFGRAVLLTLVVTSALAATWFFLGRPMTPSWPLALKGGLMLCAWLVVLLRLESRPVKEPTAAVMLTMLAVGIAAVAWFAGDPATTRLVLTLAAATVGFLGWNWFGGLPFLAPALLGGAGTVLALATVQALSDRAEAAALAVLLLIPFADGTANRLPSGSGLARRVFQPLLLALVCLLPVVLAAIIAHIAAQMPGR